MPRRRQWTGFSLAIADDTGDDEIRIVKHRTERMAEGVTQFAALVDRTGRLRRGVARNAAGE